jgi:hypothetical protein
MSATFMANATMPKTAESMRINNVEIPRPKAAKVEPADQRLSITFAAVVKDALIGHYGSLKAAAITLGIDLGQLSRELQSGDFKLKQLDKDPEARRDVADALHEAFRDDDPKAKARRLIRAARRSLDDLAEAL